jgi:hypothetical protein
MSTIMLYVLNKCQQAEIERKVNLESAIYEMRSPEVCCCGEKKSEVCTLRTAIRKMRRRATQESPIVSAAKPLVVEMGMLR